MDFAILVPISVMAIPITAIIMGGKRKIAELRVEEARLQLEGGGDGVAEELEDLREEIGHMRMEMGEVVERLDFTERLLSQVQKQDELPPGSS